MSQQQIYLAQRENDQRFSSDHELGTETCAVCEREMEERWTDMWYVNDGSCIGLRMGHEPIQGPGQRLVCSRRCLSQLVYNTAPEDVKSLMRVMARQVHEWFENVNLKSTEWCLANSFITHAVSHLDFVVHNDQMDTFAQELLGRDWRDQDYPEWLEQAISPVAPAKPTCARCGYVREAHGLISDTCPDGKGFFQSVESQERIEPQESDRRCPKCGVRQEVSWGVLVHEGGTGKSCPVSIAPAKPVGQVVAR